ncbi:unnamed protein product [Taenia asiatica]|uniref:Uncharacterized protein n=1 Tax=Taenia asiatica TaxID=60517 RepID=A0A0R3VZS6_TAEAS|nr:unnamed protein product [Taenia asiatica]
MSAHNSSTRSEDHTFICSTVDSIGSGVAAAIIRLSPNARLVRWEAQSGNKPLSQYLHIVIGVGTSSVPTPPLHQKRARRCGGAYYPPASNETTRVRSEAGSTESSEHSTASMMECVSSTAMACSHASVSHLKTSKAHEAVASCLASQLTSCMDGDDYLQVLMPLVSLCVMELLLPDHTQLRCNEEEVSIKVESCSYDSSSGALVCGHPDAHCCLPVPTLVGMAEEEEEEEEEEGIKMSHRCCLEGGRKITWGEERRGEVR